MRGAIRFTVAWSFAGLGSSGVLPASDETLLSGSVVSTVAVMCRVAEAALARAPTVHRPVFAL